VRETKIYTHKKQGKLWFFISQSLRFWITKLKTKDSDEETQTPTRISLFKQVVTFFVEFQWLHRKIVKTLFMNKIKNVDENSEKDQQ
jgi:hypothetical protein